MSAGPQVGLLRARRGRHRVVGAAGGGSPAIDAARRPTHPVASMRPRPTPHAPATAALRHRSGILATARPRCLAGIDAWARNAKPSTHADELPLLCKRTGRGPAALPPGPASPSGQAHPAIGLTWCAPTMMPAALLCGVTAEALGWSASGLADHPHGVGQRPRHRRQVSMATAARSSTRFGGGTSDASLSKERPPPAGCYGSPPTREACNHAGSGGIGSPSATWRGAACRSFWRRQPDGTTAATLATGRTPPPWLHGW